MIKVKEFLYDTDRKEHIIKIICNDVGVFGSKMESIQKEKIESVINGRYIKLLFGIRLILPQGDQRNKCHFNDGAKLRVNAEGKTK